MLTFFAALLATQTAFAEPSRWVRTWGSLADLSAVPAPFGAVAFGPAGDVVSVGTIFGSTQEVLVLVHDEAGELLWALEEDPFPNAVAAGVAVDAAGNLYVYGDTYDPATGWDVFVVSYDPAGEARWVRRHDQGGDESARAIALDAAGAVHVTGVTSAGGDVDFLVATWDAAGVDRWCVTHDASVHDVPADIAVDGAGNVYVTGTRQAGATAEDFLTVSWDANGVERWATSEGGSHAFHDIATALAVNAAGVVVSGYFYASANNDDVLTVAYDTAGALRWSRIHDGAGGHDQAHDVALDAAGNVHVVGSTATGGPSSVDFLVLSYDESGLQRWSRTNGTTDWEVATWVGVDGGGDLYVTGSATASIRLVSVDSDGEPRWQTTIGAPGEELFPQATALRSDGSLAMAAFANGFETDLRTSLHDPSGLELWSTSEPPSALVLDRATAVAPRPGGGVILVGNAGQKLATVAFDAAGQELWASFAALGEAYAHAVALDTAGNAVVAGYGAGSAGYDFVTIAHEASGAERWSRVEDAGSLDADLAYDIAVDAAGNVTVVGEAQGPAGSDVFVVAYDVDGSERWRQVLDGAAGGHDSAVAVATDSAGNVYVAGSTTAADLDLLLVAYDAAGSERWRRSWDGGGNDQAVDVDLDALGNVYLAGTTWDGASFNVVVLAWDGDGEERWVRTADGQAGGHDFATALAVGSLGTVVVSGYSWNGSDHDYLTLAYASEGDQLWVALRDFEEGYDSAEDVAVDAAGNVYVTGSASVGGGSRALTVAYGPDGTELWAHVPGEPSGGSAVAVAPDGTVYAVGEAGNDALVVSYDAACSSSSPVVAGGWHLLGLPCAPHDATVEGTFGDDLAPENYGTRWWLFGLVEGDDDVVPLALDDLLEQGRGYWLQSLDGGIVDVGGTMARRGCPGSFGDCFAVPLSGDAAGRWNLVGHPYGVSVPWADVRLRDALGDEYDLAEAVAEGLADRVLHQWTGGGYAPIDGTTPGVEGTLDVWEGGLLRVFEDATLLVPATSQGPLPEGLAGGGHFVRLAVTGDGLSDEGNLLGRLDDSLDGHDLHDLAELPPFGSPYLTIVFPHPDWGPEAGDYATDYRQARPGAGGTWNFEVRSDVPRTVTLTWAGEGTPVNGVLARSTLRDVENAFDVDPVGSPSYLVAMAGTVHRFTWRVDAPPMVSAGLDQEVGEGELVALAPATFGDEDVSDNHSAVVDWGDGTVSSGAVGNGTVSASHVYADDGRYTVAVTVTDSAGLAASDTLEVLVANEPPVVALGVSSTLVAPGEELEVIAAFFDPGAHDTHSAAVDWGDGTLEPATVDPPLGLVSASHVYPAEGSWSVVLCVTDDDGGAACDAVAISVAFPSSVVFLDGFESGTAGEWDATVGRSPPLSSRRDDDSRVRGPIGRENRGSATEVPSVVAAPSKPFAADQVSALGPSRSRLGEPDAP